MARSRTNRIMVDLSDSEVAQIKRLAERLVQRGAAERHELYRVDEETVKLAPVIRLAVVQTAYREGV